MSSRPARCSPEQLKLSDQPRYLCECGNGATIAADVFCDGGTRPARLLLCSPMCHTVSKPGWHLEIIIEGEGFEDAVSCACWCPSERHPEISPIVPFCPTHGPRG